jgi:hypothetical protein
MTASEWEAIRWVICIGLGGLFGLGLIGNWAALFGTLRTKKPTSLIFPFICGPMCAVACLLCPNDRVRSLAWCPLVLDPGILAVTLVAVAWLFGCRPPHNPGPCP